MNKPRKKIRVRTDWELDDIKSKCSTDSYNSGRADMEKYYKQEIKQNYVKKSQLPEGLLVEYTDGLSLAEDVAKRIGLTTSKGEK